VSSLLQQVFATLLEAAAAVLHPTKGPALMQVAAGTMAALTTQSQLSRRAAVLEAAFIALLMHRWVSLPSRMAQDLITCTEVPAAATFLAIRASFLAPVVAAVLATVVLLEATGGHWESPAMPIRNMALPWAIINCLARHIVTSIGSLSCLAASSHHSSLSCCSATSRPRTTIYCCNWMKA